MIRPLFDQWSLRSFVSEDAASLVVHANNRNVSINLRDSFPYPYTLRDAKRWLKNISKHQPEMAWAIARVRDEQSSMGELIGGIGIHPLPDVYRCTAEIGYWLSERFWGKGIATAAVKAIVSHVFEQMQYHRMFAGVFEWNPASARVLEKAGFTLESRQRKAVFKDGKLIDQLIYVILKEEWQDAQQKNQNPRSHNETLSISHPSLDH